jgi:guanosine-3',5'-bis(diphosphate) 3'-pyrophosphohydrolase
METHANRRYLEALAFAVERHGGARQPRKGTGFPYVVHPIRVAEILDRYGYDEDVVVAGMLHDVVEDAGVTHAELERAFGIRVSPGSPSSSIRGPSHPRTGSRKK